MKQKILILQTTALYRLLPINQPTYFTIQIDNCRKQVAAELRDWEQHEIAISEIQEWIDSHLQVGISKFRFYNVTVMTGWVLYGFPAADL